MDINYLKLSGERPRATPIVPRAAKTLRHPAEERKEQHPGVKNATLLKRESKIVILLAVKRHVKSREGFTLPVLYGCSLEQLRLYICCTDEVPAGFLECFPRQAIVTVIPPDSKVRVVT